MAADLSRGKSVGDALNIGKSAVVNKKTKREKRAVCYIECFFCIVRMAMMCIGREFKLM